MGEETSRLYQRGLELFNRREFFECHEVLEEIWTPARGRDRLFLQALIHFAVGFYHHQRANPAGASRQLRKGLRKIEGYLPAYGGIETAALRDEVARLLPHMEAGAGVDDFPSIRREKTTPPLT
jgi:hypothetical protein